MSQTQTTEPTPEYKVGSLEVYGDDCQYEGKCDRLAMTRNNRLLFASIVCDSVAAKGFRAVLNGGSKRVTVRAGGVELRRPKAAYDWRDPVETYVSGMDTYGSEGYEFHAQKLNYGLVHVFVWSKSKDFILTLSPTSLWLKLKSDMVTTPLVPWWLPWLESQLLEGNYLTHPWNWRTQCATLNITTGELDDMVSRGIRKGYLSIRPPLSLPYYPSKKAKVIA